jgi:hypothetical protein
LLILVLRRLCSSHGRAPHSSASARLLAAELLAGRRGAWVGAWAQSVGGSAAAAGAGGVGVRPFGSTSGR